jgi:hypothetical protein
LPWHDGKNQFRPSVNAETERWGFERWVCAGQNQANTPERQAAAGRARAPLATPNISTTEIKQLARKYGPQAIELCAKMAGFVEGFPPSESDQTRLAAAKEIMDRAYGRAAQPLASDDDTPLVLNIIRYGDLPETRRRGHDPFAENVSEHSRGSGLYYS